MREKRAMERIENMRATVIVDNIESGAISGEWGLCICIEYGDKKVLLDTGASELFAENARKLNISLEDVDYGVLSHAHYDHANGMEEFFQVNTRAKFYIRDGCGENCYAEKESGKEYIGMPKGVLEEYRERIVYISGDYTIAEGISLIPHKTKGLEEIGRREKMYRKEKNRWIPDDFSHEQSLVFDTPKGLVVFNSCCHGGAANIIREAAAAFPDKKVFALVGGFHTYNKCEKEIRDLAGKIKETGIEYVCTGHCTGDKAYALLKEELGGRLHQLRIGLVMEF